MKTRSSYIKTYYASIALKALCDGVMILALPLMVLSTTGSVLWTGFVGFVALFAVFLGCLFSRTLIQLMGAKRLILTGFAANLIGISGILFCFAQPTLSLPLLLVFVVFDRAFDAAAFIAIEASIPELGRFTRTALSRLYATNESLMSSAAVVGPALTGWMLATFNPLYVFAMAGVLCVTSIICFIGVLPFYRRNAQHRDSANMLEVTRWMWGIPKLKYIIILIIILMGSTASLEEIMLPALVDQTTKDPSDIGWIMAAYSLSTLISAMLYAAYHEHLSDHWLIKLCIVGVGLLFLGMVIFDSPFYIMIVAFISGFVFGPLGPIIDSQLLTETPKKFRVAMLAATYTLGIGIAPIMVILHAAIIDFYSIKLLCSLLTGVMIITLFIPTHQRST